MEKRKLIGKKRKAWTLRKSSPSNSHPDLNQKWIIKKFSITVAASSKRKASSEIRGLTMNDTAAATTITSSNNRRGSVDGVITRCGLCSLLASLLRRAMCVGSRRGSGESYYQELADTAVSLKIIINYSWFFFINFFFGNNPLHIILFPLFFN